MGPAGISQILSGEPAAANPSRSSGSGLPVQLQAKASSREASSGARLDKLLVEDGSFASREKAQRAIRAGAVLVDGAVTTRPSQRVGAAVRIEVSSGSEGAVVEENLYASRGGAKLAAALDRMGLDDPGLNPMGWTCLDVGASTGGFTDCLLRRGAARVYAVDVGRGQLVERLRSDPRVTSWDGINARFLPEDLLSEPCRLVVVDLSFISLLKVLPAVLPHLQPGGYLVPLIKPQFEVGPAGVGKGGLVRDEALRLSVIHRRVEEIAAMGLEVMMPAFDCAFPGSDGNREAFACLRKLSPEEPVFGHRKGRP